MISPAGDIDRVGSRQFSSSTAFSVQSSNSDVLASDEVDGRAMLEEPYRACSQKLYPVLMVKLQFSIRIGFRSGFDLINDPQKRSGREYILKCNSFKIENRRHRTRGKPSPQGGPESREAVFPNVFHRGSSRHGARKRKGFRSRCSQDRRCLLRTKRASQTTGLNTT